MSLRRANRCALKVKSQLCKNSDLVFFLFKYYPQSCPPKKKRMLRYPHVWIGVSSGRQAAGAPGRFKWCPVGLFFFVCSQKTPIGLFFFPANSSEQHLFLEIFGGLKKEKTCLNKYNKSCVVLFSKFTPFFV